MCDVCGKTGRRCECDCLSGAGRPSFKVTGYRVLSASLRKLGERPTMAEALALARKVDGCNAVMRIEDHGNFVNFSKLGVMIFGTWNNQQTAD